MFDRVFGQMDEALPTEGLMMMKIPTGLIIWSQGHCPIKSREKNRLLRGRHQSFSRCTSSTQILKKLEGYALGSIILHANEEGNDTILKKGAILGTKLTEATRLIRGLLGCINEGFTAQDVSDRRRGVDHASLQGVAMPCRIPRDDSARRARRLSYSTPATPTLRFKFEILSDEKPVFSYLLCDVKHSCWV
uniref:Uncharacterized protein n=1 Tax=Oryza meridionalis TaxID=40149 RepID=A0A0E0EYG3_9ORYZ